MPWQHNASVRVYRSLDLGYFPDPTYCLWIAHIGNRYIAFKEQLWYRKVASEVAAEMKELSEGMHVYMTYCLPLDAPIWMGDFTFKPLSEVKVGDTVIGTCNRTKPMEATPNSRKGRGRRTDRYEDRLRRVKVTAIHRTRQEVVKLTMASGRTVYCTPDHRWLSGATIKDKPYIIPKIGSTLVRVVDDPGYCPDIKKAAWLGGIYDGEGCRNYIAQDKRHNPEVYDQIYTYLKDLGFDAKSVYRRSNNSPHKYESGVRFNGGFEAAIKFVNWIPALRFRLNAADRYLLVSKYRHKDIVVAIESCGMQDVGCLTTESKDFIAYGYVTSNCDPTADIKTQADVHTIKDIFENNGVPLECSINNREHYAHSVHTALSEEVEPGVPRLQIYARGCPYLIRTIPQQRYDPKHPLRMADHKDDHAVIALAYFLISNSSLERKDFKTSTLGVPKWMRPKLSDRFILGYESVRDYK